MLMKTTLFLLTLMSFLPLISIAQSKEEEIVFEYAVDLFNEGKFQDAANSFKKFMKDFPQSELKGRAHYNIALCYTELKNYAQAKTTFLEILNEPYNEKDENSLMEPYTLYKHHACRMLAFIALDEKQYEEAEKYINLFDKKYPYQHFCGNEWAAYHMFKAVMLAKVYAGTNRVAKAIEILVPHSFENGLASNARVLDELDTIVSQNFTKEEIKAELNRALTSMAVSRKKKETIVTIKLFNVEVNVDFYWQHPEPGKSAVEHYKDIIRSNPFFKKYL